VCGCCSSDPDPDEIDCRIGARSSSPRREECVLERAEGAGRATHADKARAFTIARGECVEAAAAVEIAAVCGSASDADVERVAVLADRLVAMLTRLIR